MFVTKRSLSRRTVLRGLGTTLALPFLESMVPAFGAGAVAGAAAAPLRRRLRPERRAHGLADDYWMPTAAGELEITPILKPLEAFTATSMTVIGNLSRAGGKKVTDHAVSSAGWLSGVVAKQTEAEDISLGITIDQVLAKQIGQDTPFPSLEFATEDFSGYIGGCVPGYSCTYMNTISWAGETSPLPMEINPRVAFERMFGRAGDADQRLTRMRENRSILDSMAAEARELQRPVGRAGPRAARRLSGQRARDRAAHRADRSAQRRERHRGDGAGRRARDVRGARGADVRPAGGGLPGRPDARLHVHDGARGEPADVSRRSASPRRTTTCRITATSRTRWRCTRRSTRTSPRSSRSSSSKLAPVARRRRLGARSLAHRVRQRA